MTVVSRSPDCGENNAPRIINPSKYITATDSAIRAPRPGLFSRTCPAPGISHAKRTAGNQFVEDGRDAGVAKGGVGAGVRGKPAPGISLTQSFYSIRTWTPQADAHAYTGAAGIGHLKSPASIGFQKLQFLIVDFHSVLGSRGQAEHEQALVFDAEFSGIGSARVGDGRRTHLNWLEGCARPEGLQLSILKQLQASVEIADPGGILVPVGAG